MSGEKSKNENPNLVLIGFMGTGKTSIGKLAACSLGFEFVDTDAMIVKKARKAIPRIFAEDGEAAFRDMETSILHKLKGRGNLVVSTGGGIVLREENRALLKDIGFTVWLSAKPETIYGRVATNRGRPLLRTKNPRETISQMMAERESFYNDTCEMKVDTDDLSLDEVAYGIVESARLRFH